MRITHLRWTLMLFFSFQFPLPSSEMVLTPPCCWCLWSAVWFCCSSSSGSSSSAAGKPPGPKACQSSHRYSRLIDTIWIWKYSSVFPLVPVGISITSPSPCLSSYISLFICCFPAVFPYLYLSISLVLTALPPSLSGSLTHFFPCGVASGIVTGRWQLCLISLHCAATGLCAVCVEIRREHVPFPREPRLMAGRRICAYVYLCVLYSIRVAVILPRAKHHGCFALIKLLFLAKLSASCALTPLWISSATFPFHKASSYCVRS